MAPCMPAIDEGAVAVVVGAERLVGAGDADHVEAEIFGSRAYL